ncbi:Aspartate aminotransferase [Mycena kentingensis (nom. inval.)]|nr:Aspartate aminotransferase [Mycena kentingensis (nom. inval.)]
MADESPSPASPDPALPGAWSTPHRRWSSYPSPRSSPRPDRLENVLEFQRRLVHQMDSLPSSDNTLATGSSQESELTRADESKSLVADTTACSSLDLISIPKATFTRDEYPTRIPRHADLSRRLRAKDAGLDSPSPPTRFQQTLSPSSSFSLSTPVSPMIFSSPASSSLPRLKVKSSPLRHSSSYEYESSPSWDTSYGSEYDDRGMLNQSRSHSPSPLPMARRQNLAPRLSVATRTPSIEIAPAPMLTALSLPASPETSLDVEPDVVIRAPRLTPVDDDETSPWTASLSSPAFSTIPEISLSPAATCDDQDIMFLPSPDSESASPFVTSTDIVHLPLSPPSTIPDIESEAEAESSAAAYATAVVSSAWSAEGPSLSQVIPDSFQPASIAPNVEQDPGLCERQPLHPVISSGLKSSGVIGKMKKFGHKLKNILRGSLKGQNGGKVNVNVRSRRYPVSPAAFADVIDITSAAQIYESQLPASDTTTLSPSLLPLPPPPGLGTGDRSILRRPLSAHSYPHERTHVLRRPRSQGNPSPEGSTPHSNIQAPPKTLAEIKSRRRLSLPVLHLTRPSLASPKPVNIVTSSRRPRPVSSVSFNPRPAAPLMASDNSSRNSQRPSSAVTFAPRPFTAMSDSVRSPHLIPSASCREGDAQKKKNRHFSLSALSNFAVGYREEAVWQRRMDPNCRW